MPTAFQLVGAGAANQEVAVLMTDQVVFAGDVDADGLAAPLPQHLVVERIVALHGRDVVEREVLVEYVALLGEVGVVRLQNGVEGGRVRVGEWAQDEAGLLSVTVMGVVLANQKAARISRIVEFKEDLQVLLLSGLFILLAARLELADLRAMGWREALFVLALVVLVRPATAWVSTVGSKMGWRERSFIASLAPRGIVSAAMASVLALEMAERNLPHYERIVPIAFSVIMGSVVIYGLGAHSSRACSG